MISSKYIKSLDFKTIEDIYLYILDSEINGNYSQVTELINKLSLNQFKAFCKWFHYHNFMENTKPLIWFINKRRS